MARLLVRLRALAVWIFCNRPSVDDRLASDLALVDCRFFAQLRIRIRNVTLHRWNGADVLAVSACNYSAELSVRPDEANSRLGHEPATPPSDIAYGGRVTFFVTLDSAGSALFPCNLIKH